MIQLSRHSLLKPTSTMLKVHTKPTEADLKCLIAAAEGKVENLTIERVDSSRDSLPLYAKLSNANAIVKMFSLPEWQVSDLVVDEWLEWEETKLSPLIENVKSKKQDVSELMTLLSSVKPTGTFWVLNQFTAADIVLSVSLKAALALLDNDSKQNSSLQSYVQEMFKRPDFVTALAVGGSVPSPPVPQQKNSSLDSAKASGETYDSMLEIMQHLFSEALHAAFPSLSDVEAEVARTKKAEHGEYQCNSAMMIFKKVKGDTYKSPRSVGQAIMDAMPTNSVIEKMTLAGPGFINTYLTPAFLANRMHVLLNQGVHALPCPKLKIAVDFSSPNIAKDMHVGHLRSTIIGDAMCRILEFQGHEVVRINHVGDWGTQFGMLIEYLVTEYPNWQNEMPNIQDLTALYKAAKLKFDKDEKFKANSRDNVVKLQSGDSNCLAVWKVLCDISRKEFQKVYDRLQVRLNECGESFYNDKIPGVIKILEDKGLTTDSDGALCVFTEKYQQPLMMRKRDGSFLYDSTDMAAVWYRLTQLKADWCIYYTDFSQNDHFGLFFEVARMAGIVKPEIHRLDHIGFGTVNDESGKRFKTRSGEVVRLVDLLDESKTRMKNQLLERIEAGQTSLPREEVDAAAEKIGYGALKYFDLRQSPTSNYIFSYDRMLSTTGDTAVYLLFAYARFSSIIRKSGANIQELKKTAKLELDHPMERALAGELAAFQDMIEFIKKDLMSNRLCMYLYTVADKVQGFATKCRVLGSPEQNSRLLLCQATLDVMKTCFSLLGIEPLDQI